MKSEYAENIRDWLDRGDWSDWFAVTLTMKQKFRSESGELVFLDVDKASQNLRHFLSVTNTDTFGNAFRRYNKRLEVIPVFEYDDSIHLHFHLFIKKPQRYTASRFAWVIRKNWSKTDWGLWSIDIVEDADYGWLKYITKKTSVEFENVDLGNLWLS